MKGLCMTNYTIINYGMLNAFVEKWHSETLSFHLPLGDISITLDDVSCLLHLPIRGRLLGHWRITKDETFEMMIDYLGDDPAETNEELDTTRGLMLGLNTWKSYIQFNSIEHIRLQVMTSRWGSTKCMLWEHIVYIWLALQFFVQECHLYKCHIPTVLLGFQADPWVQLWGSLV